MEESVQSSMGKGDLPEMFFSSIGLRGCTYCRVSVVDNEDGKLAGDNLTT